MIFLCVLFPVTASPVDEYELFQEGYDLYLSCQPSKAIEKFEIFLKEFPDSSAKDAVLFWLGKALIQMGKLAESEKAFNEIKANYPNSPFNYQARKELEKITALPPRYEINEPSKAKINDKDLSDVKSERDRLKVLAEEYKKKIEGYENMIAELSAKEKDFERIKNENARLEERIKDIERSNLDTTEYLKKIREEKDKLMAETELLRTRILNLENVKKDLETKEALLDKKQKEIESLKTEIDLLTKKITEKESIETNLKKEIDAEKKRIEDYNNKLTEMNKKEKEAEIIVKEKESLIKKLASMEKEISTKNEESERVKREKERLESEIMEMKKKLALMMDVGKELEKKETIVRGMEKEIKELKENLQNQQDEQERLREKLQNLAKEKEGVHTELQQIQGRYNDVLKENEILKAKSVAITDQINQLKEKIDENKRLQNSLSETEKRVLALETERAKASEDIERLRKEKEKIVLDLEKKTEDVELLKIKISELSKREGELAKERDAAQAEAFDLKKRLKVLEDRASDLEKEISGKVEEARKIREEKERLATEVMEKEKKLALMSESNKELEKKVAMVVEKEQEIKGLKEGLQNQRGDFEKLKREKENLIKEREEVLTKLRQAEDNYNRVLKENEQLQAKSGEITEQINQLQRRLSETERKAEELRSENIKVTEDHNKLKEEKNKIAFDLKGKVEEIELLKTRLSELGNREGELIKERDAAQAEARDLKERLMVLEGRASDINKLTDDMNRLRVLLAEEKRKYDEANSRIAVLEQREKELLGLNATMKNVMESRLSEMGQRLQICEQDLSGMKKEKADITHDSEELKKSLESLTAEVLRLRGVETEAKDVLNRIPQYEARIKELERLTEDGLRERRDLNIRLQRKDEEISRLLNEKKELETIVAKLKEKEEASVPKYVVIGKERFSRDYVSSYMFRSQLLLSRIGVRNVPWRKGDPIEDFVSEEILYEEAKKLNSKDGWEYDEFKKRFNLTKDEIEYLERFGMISNLMSHECEKLPAEKSGEAVVIRYSDKDRYEKAAMVADIQNRIKLGLPIKDVVKLYPDVEYKRLSDNDINELFGELAGNFSDNEVASTFNKERFIVVRININHVEYRPFEVPEEETNKRLREHISKLVSASRAKKEIIVSID